MAGIYLISGVMPVTTSLGDFAYLGLTHREPIERLEEHIYKLEANKHSNEIIQEHYNKWGKGHIITGVISYH
jgi:hypothetical protein